MKHEFARTLRRQQTNVERKFWFALRGRQFGGFKFRRQQPIGPYIVDFVCFEARLVVELDGGQHGLEQAVAYDIARTRFLEKQGFRVLRFSNHEIHRGIGAACEVMVHHLRSFRPSPLVGEGAKSCT